VTLKLGQGRGVVGTRYPPKSYFLLQIQGNYIRVLYCRNKVRGDPV